MCFDKNTGLYSQINHQCIEGGDNKYTAIAAASILAKVERDKYIEELCNEYPHLEYSISAAWKKLTSAICLKLKTMICI